MATTLNSCAGAEIVSFPLKTSITDLEAYYANMKNVIPNIQATFSARTTNPNFTDDARTTGEIDEALNSIQVTYNGNNYQFINAQITIPTHADWIVNTNPSKPVQNKIDYIVTLENMQDKVPRFVIIVLPIILDDTVTVNNSYLNGLAYLSSDITYSLSSLYAGLNDFIYYTTCLPPHGDNAFVYVNRDGLRINSDLYQNLLATWTQQSLSSIQNRILDNLTPTQRALSRLFQNVRNATNLQEIQEQINNIQATAQTPVINSMVETWPRYTPPYDIVLNVPSTTISNSQVRTTASEEGFRNRIEGFEIGGCTGPNCGLNGRPITGESEDEESTNQQRAMRNTAQSTCVPLDLDDATDSSGNIMFDASGNISLGNVEASRKRLREQYATNQMTYVDLIKYSSPFFASLIIVATIYTAWPFVLPIVMKFMYPNTVIPMAIPPVTSTATNEFASYIVFGMIFLFGGFLIGAVVARAY